ISDNLTKIYIYDMSGQEKEVFVLNNTSSIRINQLPKGMYILKMVGKDESYSEKLIIE
ncbi:MAG: T9SS type A sorting domain-containing protein, partial [Bacteroidetes bacterium]|nr:T9SS type A sorting domain-containing protein [Bacteroidota bacterium]